MKIKKHFISQLSNISQAYTRYPLTMILFIILFVLNAWYITDSFVGYERLTQSLLVTILLTLVMTHTTERFIKNKIVQSLLIGSSLILGVIYYMILLPTNVIYPIYEVKTVVISFALFIVFIWVPTIKGKSIYFHQMFLSVFKYSFLTLFYGIILTLGFQIILSSIDFLLFNLPQEYFLHAINIVWIIIAPSFFLSLIPQTERYKQTNGSGKDFNNETEKRIAFSMPHFLQVLLNYIVIPLIGLYTIILGVYILLNIRSEFWSDNLLEPLLIFYAVIIIVVYLLACNLTQASARYFRKVFPKILIPIVLFQSLASILEIQNKGITHGRYYVIIFGVFSIFTGIVFSFLRKERAGIIVPVLLILSIISVVPPVDAFTISKKSQITVLTETLEENNMLEKNNVLPNKKVSQESKEQITSSVIYLYDLSSYRDVAYLEERFNPYDDFSSVFGFSMTFKEDQDIDSEEYPDYASFDQHLEKVIPIEEDYFLRLYLDNYDKEERDSIEIVVNSDLTVRFEVNKSPYMFYVVNQLNEEVLTYNLEELFTQVLEASNEEGLVTSEESITVRIDEDDLAVRIMALELMWDKKEDVMSAELYIFIDEKESKY